MKSLGGDNFEGAPLKKMRFESVAQPREIALPSEIWNEVFYKLLSGRENAGAHLTVLQSVCKAWCENSNPIKVKLCYELPFECIFYLPRLKTLDKVASEDIYMFEKWGEMTGSSYKEKLEEFLEESKFVNQIPPGCIKFLDKYGSQITTIKLRSTLCGPLLEEFRTRLTRLEILDLQSVSDSSYASIAKMTQLKTLTVDQMVATEEGAHRICSLTRLKRLYLYADEKYDLHYISKLTTLTRLNLTAVEADWLSIASTLLQLENLQVAGYCPHSWDVISHLSNLTRLTFNGWGERDRGHINDAGMVSICHLTHLKKLNLDYCDLTHDGLKHVSKLIKLESLKIRSRVEVPKRVKTFFYSFTHIEKLVLETEMFRFHF